MNNFNLFIVSGRNETSQGKEPPQKGIIPAQLQRSSPILVVDDRPLELNGDLKRLERQSLVASLEGCVECVAEIYRLFGYKSDLSRAVANTVRYWRRRAESMKGEFSWIKVVKYKLVAFCNSWLGEELPAKPFDVEDDPKVVLSGGPSRFVRNFMDRATFRERAEFCQSIKRAGKGMPRPPKEAVAEAVRATVQKLTGDRKVPAKWELGVDLFAELPTPEEVHEATFLDLKLAVETKDWAEATLTVDEAVDDLDLQVPGAKKVEKWTRYKDVPPLMSWSSETEAMLRCRKVGIETDISLQTLLDQCIRTARELFADKTYRDEDRFKLIFPSTSAHYISSRSKGGAVVGIQTDPDLWPSSQRDVRQRLGKEFRRLIKAREVMDDDERIDVRNYISDSVNRFFSDDSSDVKFSNTDLFSVRAQQRETERKRAAEEQPEQQDIDDDSDLEDPEDEVVSRQLDAFYSIDGHEVKLPVRPFVAPDGTQVIADRYLMNIISREEKENKNQIRNENIYEYRHAALDEQMRALYHRLLWKAVQEAPFVRPVGLSEALKTRVITAAPHSLQTVLKPLQKFTWNVLSKHPAFDLLRHPKVTIKYLQDRMGRELKDDEAYLSADWQDSTNELNPDVSNVIGETMADCIGLTPDEKFCFIRALTGHVFNVDVGDDTTEIRPQTWGQLMGSVVSFVVLCVANAAICRWAYEIGSGRKTTLRDCPLAINGDDSLLRTNQFGRKAWRLISECAGPPESIGKTYFTRRFAEINSTMFLRHEKPCGFFLDTPGKGLESRDKAQRSRETHFEFVPFVNMGLIKGLKRSEGVVGVEAAFDSGRDGTLGDRACELLRMGPPHMAPDLLRLFLAEHRDLLDTMYVPWFLPANLGGLGLPCVAFSDTSADEVDDAKLSWLYGPTEMDLDLAARIIYDSGNKNVPQPMPHAPPVDWNTHKKVLSRLPASTQARRWNDEDVEAFDRLYGVMAVDVFFNCKPWEIFDNSPKKRSVQTLRHNERVWSRAQKLPRAPFRYDPLSPPPYRPSILPVRPLP